MVTGLVVIGIKPFLSFKGVHLLLGNDLAGDKVVVNPLVTDTPNIGQTDDPIEQEIPDLYSSCAVTRAMAKKAILKNSNSDIDSTDTFIGQYFDNEIKKSLDHSLSDTKIDSSMSRNGGYNAKGGLYIGGYKIGGVREPKKDAEAANK